MSNASNVATEGVASQNVLTNLFYSIRILEPPRFCFQFSMESHWREQKHFILRKCHESFCQLGQLKAVKSAKPPKRKKGCN